ncbi:MAG: hypothetical protein ACRDU4_11825 [Mycobacterium sp.]
MIDHFGINCAHYAESQRFYDRVLGVLGYPRQLDFGEAIGYEAAVQLGAESLHVPRLWPEYHAGYFGAFVRDPDGNNVEAVCHGA